MTVAKIVKNLLLVSCTSLMLVGCGGKQEVCVPVVKMVKPERVQIDSARIEQCRYAETIDNVKCVMKNYVNVKTERDQLRSAYESVTE